MIYKNIKILSFNGFHCATVHGTRIERSDKATLMDAIDYALMMHDRIPKGSREILANGNSRVTKTLIDNRY